MTITAHGSMNHQGILQLHNNFSANSTLEASSGSLHLVGSNQRLELPDVTLANLTIKGGGIKQLSGQLTVLQELSLIDGILQANQSSPLFITPSAQINGGSTQSYVDGFLYHSGTGSKFYPVGSNGTYAPATLLNVTGTDPTVGIAYFPTTAIDGTPFHWQVQTLGGTYAGARAELTFTAPNADYSSYPDEVMVLGAERSGSGFTSLGQSSLSVRGDRFTISSDQPSNLPILTVGFDIAEDTKNLYLPNAFSASAPNPEDQVVKVYGQRISSNNFYLTIQDVWGNIVYETRSWEEASTQGWRGPVGATEVAATYRYLLKGEFVGGKRFQQSGTILHY
ncbi:MAG: hypothetical protein WA960_08165 [Tunicatimonas sp.]